MKLAYGITAARAFIVQMIYFFLPIFLKDIGMNGYQIGILMGAVTITGLLTIFPIGILNDRLKSKKLLAISFIFLALFYLGITIAKSFIILIFVFLALGAANTLSRTSMDTLIFKTKKSNKDLGKYKFAGMIATAAGMLIGAFLLSKFDFSTAFILAGIISIILTFVCNKLPSTTTEIVSLLEYKTRFMKKDVILFTIVFFLSAIHWGAESTSYTLFLKTNLGLGFTDIGWFMAVPVIFLGLTALKVSHILDAKPDFRKLLVLGLFLSGIGHITMTYPNILTSFISRIIHEIGDGIVLLIMMFGMTKLFHVSKIGGLSALFSLITMIAAFIGALIFGPIGENFGYHVPLIATGIISLIAIPFVQYKKI